MEHQVDVLKPISLMLKFFRLCGLWPRQSKYQWLYRIYTLMFHLFFTVAFDFCKHVNLFLETDLRLLTVGFFIFLAEISLVARSVNLLVNFANISRCLDVAKEISLFDKTEVQIVEKNLSFFSKVMYFYFGSSTTACIFSWGAPLFSSEPMLPYPGWYPVDWKTNNQSYWLAYWYQVIGTAYQAHAIVLLQLFSIYLMANIGARYDVLKYRLANLGQSLTQIRQSNKTNKTVNEKHSEETESKFIECIKLHQEVVGMVKTVESLFTVPFFVQSISSSIMFCFTAFKIAIMNISEEIPTFVFIVSFFTVFLTEIFLPCYFGNEIILKHQSLSLAIYSSEWIKASARYRKFVVLFMEMLNIDVVMKTGKIFTLTLSSFLTVINRSYSLFAVLQNTLNR